MKVKNPSTGKAALWYPVNVNPENSEVPKVSRYYSFKLRLPFATQILSTTVEQIKKKINEKVVQSHRAQKNISSNSNEF